VLDAEVVVGRGEVDDAVDGSAEVVIAFSDGAGVADIALDERRLGDGARGGDEIEVDDLVPARGEFAVEIATDEPGPACHQNLHGRFLSPRRRLRWSDRPNERRSLGSHAPGFRPRTGGIRVCRRLHTED
jgi:hypothetical protein